MTFWLTSRRRISLERPLVMGILNVTPDSFSDGGSFTDPAAAIRQAERMISDGVDIIDIGGESTRPGSKRVSAEVETGRVVPVIEAIASRFDTTISIDTSKSGVAAAALQAGAEIVNDISGLRFDPEIGAVAARANAGLVVMHSRGTFDTLHSEPPVEDIFAEVIGRLRLSVDTAHSFGVNDDHIALDIGIGFGKTLTQNLSMIANLGKFADAFTEYPLLVGTSRKSFISKICGDTPAKERLGGSIATALIAVENGARIVRVHDVRETVQALNVARSVWRQK